MNHLSHGNSRVFLILLGQVGPGWSQVLTMATPWRKELDEVMASLGVFGEGIGRKLIQSLLHGGFAISGLAFRLVG